MVSVWRGFLFLWVLGMGYVILLWHSLSLPYNYFLYSKTWFYRGIHILVLPYLFLYRRCPNKHTSRYFRTTCAQAHTARQAHGLFTIVLSPQCLRSCTYTTSSLVLQHHTWIGNTFNFSAAIFEHLYFSSLCVFFRFKCMLIGKKCHPAFWRQF